MTLNIRAAGFGLGALNDADDDDVDFYDNTLPKESRRMAFEAGDEDPETILPGHRRPVPSKVWQILILVPILMKRFRLVPLDDLSSTTGLPSSPVSFWGESFQQKTRGESDPSTRLSGVYRPIRFEPPLIPANWSPDPTRVWESKWDLQAKNQDAVTAPVGSAASWKTKMTADQVRANYSPWLNLMGYFTHVAWILARRSTSPGST